MDEMTMNAPMEKVMWWAPPRKCGLVPDFVHGKAAVALADWSRDLPRSRISSWVEECGMYELNPDSVRANCNVINGRANSRLPGHAVPAWACRSRGAAACPAAVPADCVFGPVTRQSTKIIRIRVLDIKVWFDLKVRVVG
ncbi:hypothetical protein [Burkholderia stabilis]|uniref:hypothetical protein n=1 Tax=Burkholderia stabilis TaxID=95485 RepID=UPI001146B6A3|nr:hypothetical protein [Burkholderia stabilis]